MTFSVLFVLCFRARLFIDALCPPAWKGLTYWLAFVMSNCEVITFQLVSWVRCGLLIFDLFLTFMCFLGTTSLPFTLCCRFEGGGSVVVDFLFIVTPIVGVCNCSMFCCTLLYVHSSIAIILMGKRKLIALLNLSSWCLLMDERLFLAVPRGCLQFVIVVFPDHTHYF